MKHLLLLGLALAFSANVHAQDTKAERARQDVKHAANKVADKTEDAAEHTGMLLKERQKKSMRKHEKSTVRK